MQKVSQRQNTRVNLEFKLSRRQMIWKRLDLPVLLGVIYDLHQRYNNAASYYFQRKAEEQYNKAAWIYNFRRGEMVLKIKEGRHFDKPSVHKNPSEKRRVYDKADGLF